MAGGGGTLISTSGGASAGLGAEAEIDVRISTEGDALRPAQYPPPAPSDRELSARMTAAPEMTLLDATASPPAATSAAFEITAPLTSPAGALTGATASKAWARLDALRAHPAPTSDCR